MTIIRAAVPAAVDWIKDKLLVDPGQSPEGFADFLKTMLADRSDEILLLIGYEATPDGAGNEVLGYIVATTSPGDTHVFIHQAWASPKLTGTGVTDQCLFRVAFWATEMGRNEIRIETRREPEPFLRRWNFRPYSSILTFGIPTNFDEFLRSGDRGDLTGKPEPEAPKPPAEGSNNGQEQRSTDEEHADNEAASRI